MSDFKKYIKLKYLPLPLLLIIVLYVFSNFIFVEKEEIELVEVKKDKFIKILTETGEIQAVNFTVISVPRIRRTQFQIVELVDEGTVVKKGDLLIKFDQTEMYKDIETLEDQLEAQEAELEKIKVSQNDQMIKLENSLDQAKYNLDLAKVRKELLKYESRINQEEAEIQMKQAEIDFAEAEKKIASQKIINESEIEKQQIRIKQIQNRIQKAYEDLARMEIKSPMPGLVVYHQERFGPFGGEKISLGDNVRPGQYVIQLPDLSKMKVVFGINEVDRDRVWAGQEGTVTLEAYPEMTLTGVVTQINKITDWWGGDQSNVKLFSVEMELNESNDKIRPGLSAQIQLVMDEQEDVLQVPLSAVFEQDGKNHVLLKGSNPKPREISIAERNYTNAIIENGLKEGDKIVKDAVNYYGNKMGKRKYDVRISKISEFLEQHFDNIKKLGIEYDYDANRGKVDTVRTSQDEEFQLPAEVKKMLEERGIEITPELLERFKNRMKEGGQQDGQRQMRFQMQPGQRQSTDGQKREFRMDSGQGQQSGDKKEIKISPDQIKKPDKKQEEKEKPS